MSVVSGKGMERVASSSGISGGSYSGSIPNSSPDIAPLQDEAVLSRIIPWEGYQRARLITAEELEFIKSYDKKADDVKRVHLDREGVAYAELFLNLLVKIAKDETLQYVLTLIDEMLTADESRVHLFLRLKDRNETFPFNPLLRLLSRSSGDWYTNQKACKILSLFMLYSTDVSGDDVQFLFRWLSEQLRKAAITENAIALSALQLLLRKDAYRLVFYGEDGLKLLAKVLRPDSSEQNSQNLQILYQGLFCLWLLSFNHEIAANFTKVKGLVKEICEIIKREAESVKVRRVALATLRNLLGKHANNNKEMISSGLLKTLGQLAQRKQGDPDVEADINDLNEGLEKDLKEMSSFDMYRQEVLSGNLEWSPVHKSETFWRENAKRLEEEDCQLIRVLIDLLKTSTNTKILAIACYDMGEFVRFHPRGRDIVTRLYGKVEIMQQMMNQDPEVQKHALLALQKIMVHNWEYLNAPVAAAK